MKKFILFFSSFGMCLFSDNSVSAEEQTRIGLVIGTRPEAIKVIPLFLELKKRGVEAEIIFTGQHKEMVEDIFTIFNVSACFDLKIMKPGQDLFYLTNAILEKTKEVYANHNYAWVIVQGDTTSAYASALSAFYLNIPIIHLEAGLRSHNLFRPFPEEAYRQMISRLASLHLAPTSQASDNLIKEGIDLQKIFVVGNTVVDALRLMKEKISKSEIRPPQFLIDFFDKAKDIDSKTVLLTMHRRESLQNGMQEVFKTIKELLLKNKKISILYPMHPNPRIKSIFNEVFNVLPDQLNCCSPLNYNDLTYALQNVDWVLTDSGGIQEEAVSLNKPTLVLREETDRPEAILAGKAQLVGTNRNSIENGINWLFTNNEQSCNSDDLIYGDGFAAVKSTEVILDFLKNRKEAFK